MARSPTRVGCQEETKLAVALNNWNAMVTVIMLLNNFILVIITLARGQKGTMAGLTDAVWLEKEDIEKRKYRREKLGLKRTPHTCTHVHTCTHTHTADWL